MMTALRMTKAICIWQIRVVKLGECEEEGVEDILGTRLLYDCFDKARSIYKQ